MISIADLNSSNLNLGLNLNLRQFLATWISHVPMALNREQKRDKNGVTELVCTNGTTY